MELEKQVVSLELAKQLKELGVKQESLFKWLYGDQSAELRSTENLATSDEHWISLVERVAAFTVAELGEMFTPDEGYASMLRPFGDTGDGKWEIYAVEGEYARPTIYANTEADARAKMLVYLLENHLLPTPSQV